MRRETDEVVRGFLALNALLREELRDIRRLFAARASETKYNPNWRLQPRAPMGTREGGRWIDGGGKDDGPKQARPQPRPRPPQQTPRTPPQQTPRRETPAREVTPQRPNGPQANPARSGIAIPLPRTAPVAGSSISLALRLFRVSPLTLAAGLYGDTPRPDIVTTVRSVPGVDDLVLVESHNRDSDYRSATFRRVLRPRQRTPLIVFGVDTGFASVTPEELETLPVDVNVDGNYVTFDQHALALAYGREIPGVATFGPVSAPTPELVPITPEEQRLVYNLRRLNSRNIDIGAALQQLRDQEADTSGFVARLRASGLRRWEINHVISALREARARRPYVRPTDGLMLEMFPGLATAGADQMVYPAPGALVSNARQIAANAANARDVADALVREIQALNPSYQPITFNDPSNFPTTLEGRANYIDRLRLEHAAELFRVNGEVQALQVEMARYLQRHTDIAYAEALELLRRGELELRDGFDENWAIGRYVDEATYREAQSLVLDLGLASDAELVRVHRREYITRRTFRIPDMRVADIFLDVSVSEKVPGRGQVVEYFGSQAQPTYVIIVRPTLLGGTYIITPPSNRFRRR